MSVKKPFTYIIRAVVITANIYIVEGVGRIYHNI